MAASPQGHRTENHAPLRVVILGGGYGGIYAALGLKKAVRRGKIDLSLISRDNFFLYQPMLAEVVSGTVEPPHIVNPIRRLLPSAKFHQAEVEAVVLAYTTSTEPLNARAPATSTVIQNRQSDVNDK